MKVFALALTFILLMSLDVQAKSKFQLKPTRAPASAKDLVLTLASPPVQAVEDADALAFYEALLANQAWDKVDRMNLEEFARLADSLKARGFTPLTKRLVGKVFTTAQRLVLRRAFEQAILASDEGPAHTIVTFDFTYAQSFVGSTAPTAQSVQPRVVLEGSLFLKCEPKAQEKCSISAISLAKAGIAWGHFYSNRMGGMSSAGGESAE